MKNYLFYIVPLDRTLNETYTEAIKTCAGSLADWYKDQLGNTKTHPDDPDPDAIMSTGFRRYPDCYLLDADKETLSASSFIY